MKKILKWAGYSIGAILMLLVVAIGAVYIVSNNRMNRIYEVVPAAMVIPDDADAIERGRHVAVIRGCVDCHGEDLGGKLSIDAMPVMQLRATNLTRGRGGVADTYSDTDWVRAIRHGVRADGKPLYFMPSYEYQSLSEDDMGALVAFIKSVPPVDREFERSTIGPLGRVLYLTGELPLLSAEIIDHEGIQIDTPDPGPTAAYGEYLAVSCTGCHGADFAGGRIPGTPPTFPPATNITPHESAGIGAWSEDDFRNALRTGIRPDGRQLADEMPWQLTREMTDEEIKALWLFLQSLPAKAESSR